MASSSNPLRDQLRLTQLSRRAGNQWAIPAHQDSGHIVLTVPAAVVAASRFPAVLDPQIVVTPIE